jgi:hypothetical protein
VEIDIEQRRFAGGFVDDVRIPDFLEEGLRGHSFGTLPPGKTPIEAELADGG